MVRMSSYFVIAQNPGPSASGCQCTGSLARSQAYCSHGWLPVEGVVGREVDRRGVGDVGHDRDPDTALGSPVLRKRRLPVIPVVVGRPRRRRVLGPQGRAAGAARRRRHGATPAHPRSRRPPVARRRAACASPSTPTPVRSGGATRPTTCAPSCRPPTSTSSAPTTTSIDVLVRRPARRHRRHRGGRRRRDAQRRRRRGRRARRGADRRPVRHVQPPRPRPRPRRARTTPSPRSAPARRSAWTSVASRRPTGASRGRSSTRSASAATPRSSTPASGCSRASASGPPSPWPWPGSCRGWNRCASSSTASRRRCGWAGSATAPTPPTGFAPSWRERLDDGLLDVRLVLGDRRLARTRLVAEVLVGRLRRSPGVPRAAGQRAGRRVDHRSAAPRRRR